MIWLYTGRPRSGKSLHAARDILDASLNGQQVIANFAIKPTKKQIRTGKLPLYWENDEITVKRLISYAKENHKYGKEGQTLLIIDECGILFNCRAFNTKGRNEWVKFFSQHGKYGYNIILIAHWDRMIDKQIRIMAEYNVIHRRANNFRFIGVLLTMLRIKMFVAIELWYGTDEVNRKEFFVYKRKLGNMYDSYAEFHSWDDDDAAKQSPRNAPPDGGGEQGAPPPSDGAAPNDLQSFIPLPPHIFEATEWGVKPKPLQIAE